MSATPGAWHASELQIGSYESLADGCDIFSTDGTNVALAFHKSDQSQAETLANARLMAAAPALLAAAKRALTVLKTQGHSVQRGNVLDALEFAIGRTTTRYPLETT